MSLHVGDIRELYMTTPNDTAYSLWKITGKARRPDGQEVFISEWYINSLDSNDMYYSFDFIRDGYYYGTEMDSSSEYPENPYLEEKLAPINPFDGETFIQTAGVHNLDTSQDYNNARHLIDFDTPAGKFNNVYCIIGNRGAPYSVQVKTYYAKDWGYLGIEYIVSQGYVSERAVVNYMKINGMEIGKYVDMSKLPAKKYHVASRQTVLISPYGILIKRKASKAFKIPSA